MHMVGREHGFGFHEVTERRKSLWRAQDVKNLSVPSRRNEISKKRCMRMVPLEKHSSSGAFDVLAISHKLRFRSSLGR